MKKIFIVTGANGFLGNNIIRALNTTEEDSEVRAVVHKGSKSPDALGGLNCKKYECDVKNIETLSEAFSVPKDAKVFVIHAAGT